jgi:nitrogen fixation protein NifX
MKIAFATTDGKSIDEHFGRAARFVVYELTEGGVQYVEERTFGEGTDTSVTSTRGQGQAHEDAVQAKVDRLADCRLIYMTEIGGPSAARLVRKGIMPLKVKAPGPIEQELERLSAMARNSPPIWLRKAMVS